MLSRLLRRPSHGTVVAYLALFVALGGSAYAVNTVNSTDIVDGQVKSVDIANDDIQSGDIKDNSVNTFDVHSFLGVDVVDGTLTSADIGTGAVESAEVLDHSLIGDDIANNSIGGFQIGPSVSNSEIENGTLNDEDVGQTVAVDFPADIGVVNATSCVNRLVGGLNALGDHILLTPSVGDANGALMYDAKFDVDSNNVTIHVCNFSNANINDGTTHFSLLVFDAQ